MKHLVLLLPLIFVLACGDGSQVTLDAAPATDTSTVSNVVIEIIDAPSNPSASGLVVAYQDGDGPWQAGPDLTAATLTLRLQSVSFAVAVGCVPTRAGPNPAVTIKYAMVTSINSPLRFPAGMCGKPPLAATGSIMGTLTSVADATHDVAYGMANRSFSSVDNQPLDYALAVAAGTHDLLVSRQLPNGTVDHYGIERDVAVAAAPLLRNYVMDQVAAPYTVPLPTTLDPRFSIVFSWFQSLTTRSTQLDTVPPFDLISPPLAQYLDSDAFEALVITGESFLDNVSVNQVWARPTPMVIPSNSFAPISVSGTGADLTVSWTPIVNAGATAQPPTYSLSLQASRLSVAISWDDSWIGGRTSVPLPDLAGVVNWPSRLTAPIRNVLVSATTTIGTYPQLGYQRTVFTRGIAAGSKMRTGDKSGDFTLMPTEHCISRGDDARYCFMWPQLVENLEDLGG
jgi:hypothetical protein